ncbi:uncharacterized protein LOC127855482 [Dreissena polymorpha]|uniref:uncharacterized protein LOC127855482 n=1 Tax=Dreissena polymorpha TaxID=45954 RepID=UPI002264E69F|nr:uncharacterized protein LOC127855482 [Dreissena polymorpha]XP_052247085.1 uncharacterized protein LOC127855482 [Dreissena polymorpha]
MATFSQSTVDKGSDSIIDFCCSPCLEHKTRQWAEFYCDNCLKLYCAKCVTLHSQLFGTHMTYGRSDTSKWPVSKEVEDFLQKCDLHEDKHLEMFCDDHSQLCCINCAFLNHRQCAKVTPISESVKGPPPDLQRLSRKIQSILLEVKKLQSYWDTSMQSLQASYDKQVHEIRQTRQKMNTIFDEIEKTTMKELDDKMTSLKASLKTDVDNGSKLKNELNQISGAINDIVDNGKAELIFIASKKSLAMIKHSEKYLKVNSVQVKSFLTFQADSHVQQYLSKLTGLGKILVSTQELPVLGDPDQVFTVTRKSEYDVSMPRDSLKSNFTSYFSKICEEKYFINAICTLSDDQILVADNKNCIKLLNHQYQVVGHCVLDSHSRDMCQISPNEVAVAVSDDQTHWVQFVSVNGRQLIKGKKLQFKHECIGIAHNLQDLYLTSGTALYKYSMKGALLNKLFEDESDFDTVHKCAVGPSGDKIFVTIHNLIQCQGMVLVLANDGKVLHKLSDLYPFFPQCIYVTDLGQLLVCCSSSYNIIQLDGEGKKKLATLATERDVLFCPMSVCYNKSTESIIVGQVHGKLLVFKVK